MKILHIDVTGPYTEGATYQENLLPAEMVKLGHQVFIWTSSYEWANGKINYVGEEKKHMSDGVVLTRMDYVFLFNDFFTNKIRKCKKIYNQLEELKPDLIMVHGGQTAIVPEVCKYVKKTPKTRLIADSHVDPLNSARGWMSRHVLHGIIYRKYIRMLVETATSFYCISPEAKNYVSKLYGVNKDKLELLPLGGNIIPDDDYKDNRSMIRSELGISDSVVNIVHSGKLYEEKRTNDLLDVMDRIVDENVHLCIIGSAEGELLTRIENAERKDDRISWLGWKTGEELIKYLCAGDLYVLPGDVSATVQSAMCCRCGIVVYPYEIYCGMEQDEICYVKNVDDLKQSLERLIYDSNLMDRIKTEAFSYAKDKLDYAAQAKQIIDGK